MNELQIEAIERKLQEMQEQLKTMKEERAVSAFPAMLPDKGKYYLSQDGFNIARPIWITLSVKEDNDQNIFPTEEIASAYGDAFRVMLELRRCAGAGHCYEEYGDKWGYTYDGVCITEAEDVSLAFTLVPPFPTEELCQAAIDKIGKERIIAAYKLLANVK